MYRIAGLSALVLLACTVASAQTDIGIPPVTLTQSQYVFDTAEQHKIRVAVVAKGLRHPWSVALLPNGDALVTERSRALRIVRNATGADGKPSRLEETPVAGLPVLSSVFLNGGLHDVALHPQFAQNGLIYFTFNKPGAIRPPDGNEPPISGPPIRKSRFALMRARFDGQKLSDVKELFVGEEGDTTGSRIAFGKDGTVYLTTGAPFDNSAQRLDTIYGKVLRLKDDGSIPADNPFVGRAGASGAVFSTGHRDQHGLAIHPVTGAVMNAEHGPNGGDEVNLILPGRNYGWPTVSFGRDYEGPLHSPSPVAEGVEHPLIVWLPGIGPTGLTVYWGDRLAAWKGNIFVGSAQRGEVPRTGGLERVVVNDKLEEVRRETLLTDLHQRIRDVRQGGDGLLYVVTDEDDGALLRIEPVP